MTQLSPEDSGSVTDAMLAEMLAGCEGVTPGPWRTHNRWPGEVLDANGYEVCDPSQGPHLHESHDGSQGHWGTIPDSHVDRPEDEESATAAHIARCDPNTVASIIRELQALRSSPSVGTAGAEAVRQAFNEALDFALDGPDPAPEALEFLRVWREGGDLSEWPEFVASPSPAQPETGGVRVKPLEWIDYEAETPFGNYVIAAYGKWWAVYFNDDLSSGEPRTVDDAKAAAQADYERRILSALSPVQPQPKDEGVTEDAYAEHEGIPAKELAATVERYGTALTIIADGSFVGAADTAISGNWQGFTARLQNIAKAALSHPSKEAS